MPSHPCLCFGSGVAGAVPGLAAFYGARGFWVPLTKRKKSYAKVFSANLQIYIRVQ